MSDTLSQTCRSKPRRTPLAIAMASAISLAVLPSYLLAEPEQNTGESTEVAEPDVRLQKLTSDYRNLEDELERTNTALVALEDRLADSESEREALESRVSEAEQQREQAEDAIAAARSEAEQAQAEVKDALAQRQSLEAERDSIQQELAEARDELERSEETRQARESDIAALEERINGLEADLAQLREASDVELAEVRSERDELDAELSQVRTERNELDAELAEVRSDTVTPLQTEVEQLRALLPASEGGELDLDSAQAAASKQASRLHTAHEALRRSRSDADDPQAEYDAIVSDLRREQSLVTRVQGGTIYTVESGETLGNVARRYYGDARRWPTIYQANQHIIENPDRVVPGLTVILP
ncbi:LysM peptidoglycan-binding domain-containing protein [Halomonas korlensis]|uniref:LysM domain-containing protein n=1 Tax=Halomonas korlensis TaxID=463301 RepID=A0A1I7FFY1_9GAMM|nr:LysM peptidoglycan-binding domain-containing protein [Halomonas korlensis]SFU35077.1 hypothetical protein SAMN04487955_101458 [Halomonas korlensis]